MRNEQLSDERRHLYDYYTYLENRSDGITHKHKRRIFNLIRQTNPKSTYFLVGPDICIGAMCCFHLLNKTQTKA